MIRPRRRRSRRAAGLLVGALALAAPSAGSPSQGGEDRPNIVLITLDTTRADRLGCYGYARPTSPALDRLARDSVVFTWAFSTSSWTLPAHASLFTGKFPSSHGALFDPDGPLILGEAIPGPGFLRGYRARGLAPGERTLAGILAREGYATGAVVAGPWMKRVFGLDRGFAEYDDSQISSLRGRLAAQVTDSALEWIARHAKRRFFLFLNYYDPHGPYGDPEGLAREFLPPGAPVLPAPPEPTQEFRDAVYDGEIRYMDRHIGRLLDGLEQRGLYDGTWIIVTADHGELLGEHGKFGHGRYLFQEEIRVPLIVKYPAGEVAPGRSARPIQLTDILPMVLERLGISVPPDVRAAAPGGGGHPIFAEVHPLPVDGYHDGLSRRAQSYDGEWRAIFDGGFKLLWNSAGRHRLYDVAADPGEAFDLTAGQPERARAMTAALEAFLARLPAPAPPGAMQAVDEQTRRALEQLGYLE